MREKETATQCNTHSPIFAEEQEKYWLENPPLNSTDDNSSWSAVMLLGPALPDGIIDYKVPNQTKPQNPFVE